MCIRDRHTDRHKLLAEVENVITDKSIVSIYICLLCKSIQRTVSKQLNMERIQEALGKGIGCEQIFLS